MLPFVLVARLENNGLRPALRLRPTLSITVRRLFASRSALHPLAAGVLPFLPLFTPGHNSKPLPAASAPLRYALPAAGHATCSSLNFSVRPHEWIKLFARLESTNNPGAGHGGCSAAHWIVCVAVDTIPSPAFVIGLRFEGSFPDWPTSRTFKHRAFMIPCSSTPFQDQPSTVRCRFYPN